MWAKAFKQVYSQLVVRVFPKRIVTPTLSSVCKSLVGLKGSVQINLSGELDKNLSKRAQV